MISDYGIKDDEQFSHTGREDDFEGLSLVCEGFCEMTNDRIAASCRESGPIEERADRLSTTGDMGGTEGHRWIIIMVTKIERILLQTRTKETKLSRRRARCPL